ncbi:MAG TPA: hypothetical protein VGJ26_11975 [Pirellulales bacterium]|jgi:hypothetical protein
MSAARNHGARFVAPIGEAPFAEALSISFDGVLAVAIIPFFTRGYLLSELGCRKESTIT